MTGSLGKHVKQITQNELRELLRYDPVTGDFVWLVTRSRFAVKGAKAGGLHCEGYWYVGIHGKKWMAHRLAWLYMTGEFPRQDIDHINGVRSDNRFVNLRAATRSQNIRNAAKRRGALSKYKGVSKHFDRWHAQIFCDGARISLKYHASEIDAARAYDRAAKRMHGEYARLNFPGEANV